MEIHLLSGFLGSGKTTAIQRAADLLQQQGKRVGIITNDQGSKLVDGSFFSSLAIPSREVINGCFCCNYNALDQSIGSLQEKENTEIIFAESVGSCTDMIATVLKPLLEFRPEAHITISTFADVRLLQLMLDDGGSFDETIRYIYLKQLEEAGILIINKVDLVTDAGLEIVKKMLQEKYPDKIVLWQNSLQRESILRWLETLDSNVPGGKLRSLDIDYDVYAAGEAKMAWLDQSITVLSNDNNALGEIEKLVNTIYKKIIELDYPIGHLKFLVNNAEKISFTAGDEHKVRMNKPAAVTADLLANMRVQTTPQKLEILLAESIAETVSASGCKITTNSQASFQPGYPKPAYRW